MGKEKINSKFELGYQLRSNTNDRLLLTKTHFIMIQIEFIRCVFGFEIERNRVSIYMPRNTAITIEKNDTFINNSILVVKINYCYCELVNAREQFLIIIFLLYKRFNPFKSRF